MIRLIVFDLDGTLIDSRTDLADSTNELIRELGGKSLPADEVTGMVGEGARVLVRRALHAAALEADESRALDRFLDIYAGRLLNSTVPYAGVVDMLERLAGRFRLDVLTNKPSEPSRRILDGLGLGEFFTEILGGDSAFGRKPDPAGLEHLREAAGVDAGSVLLVGDSAIDLETARRAGVRACLARYGFGSRFKIRDVAAAPLGIDSPLDLPGVVESLNEGP